MHVPTRPICLGFDPPACSPSAAASTATVDASENSCESTASVSKISRCVATSAVGTRPTSGATSPAPRPRSLEIASEMTSTVTAPTVSPRTVNGTVCRHSSRCPTRRRAPARYRVQRPDVSQRPAATSRRPHAVPSLDPSTSSVSYHIDDTCCVSAPGCPVDCHDSLGGVATLSQPGPSR